MLACAFIVVVMNDDGTAPFGFALDQIPTNRVAGREPVSLVSTANVVAGRSTVTIDHDTTTHRRGIEPKIRVAQTIRIQDLDCRGIARAGTHAFRNPVAHRQGIAIDDLVTKTKSHHLWQRHVALGVAVLARIICPGAVMRIDRLAEFHGPLRIERLDTGVLRQAAIVRFADRAEVRTDDVIEDPRNGTGGPAIIAYHITHTRHDAVAVHVDFAISRPKVRLPVHHMLAGIVSGVVGRIAAIGQHRGAAIDRLPVRAKDGDWSVHIRTGNR